MIYFLLFFEFFKVGLFSVGGGYATLPFLYNISSAHHWYSAKELSDMLAVSSVTPGPVGINVATYAGFKTAGVLGAIMATFAVVLPAIIIVIFVYKLLNKFSENFYVQAILYAIKPAGCALVASVAFKLFKNSIILDLSSFSLQNIGTAIDIKAIAVLVILLLMSIKIKKDALIYLGVSAFLGILFNLA